MHDGSTFCAFQHQIERCKMNSEWSNDTVLSFLECYQTEPVLWDPNHRQHKDRKRISDAWERVSKLLDISVADLKKKKETLMATFRGHLRKKKASIKSGAGPEDIYKPIWFAYQMMESFLYPLYTCNNTIKIEYPVVPLEAPIDEEAEIPSPSSENTLSLEPPPPPVPVPSTHPPPTRHTVRRRVNPPEVQVAETQMNEAFNTLNNFLNKHRLEEDECDLYGRLLAKKLRKLPDHERELFMYDIDGMFVNRTRCLSDPLQNIQSGPSSLTPPPVLPGPNSPSSLYSS